VGLVLEGSHCNFSTYSQLAYPSYFLREKKPSPAQIPKKGSSVSIEKTARSLGTYLGNVGTPYSNSHPPSLTGTH
jgi:hypothetical protein